MNRTSLVHLKTTSVTNLQHSSSYSRIPMTSNNVLVSVSPESKPLSSVIPLVISVGIVVLLFVPLKVTCIAVLIGVQRKKKRKTIHVVCNPTYNGMDNIYIVRFFLYYIFNTIIMRQILKSHLMLLIMLGTILLIRGKYMLVFQSHAHSLV